MYRTSSDVAGRLIGIIRMEDWTFIPIDPGNRDYQAYLAWVAAGNVAEPYA